jgi:hypothetical protein
MIMKRTPGHTVASFLCGPIFGRSSEFSPVATSLFNVTYS